MNTEFHAKRTQILHQMAALNSMELGSLKAEYRTSASGQKSGPYFKHQLWHEGTNLSQRIPPQEAAELQEAIANRQRFDELSCEFIDLTVAHTRKTHDPLSLKKKTPPSPPAGSPKRRKSAS